MPLYSIVWKYKIKPKPKTKNIFEFEYGATGAWNSLFRTSENYKNSYLHKSEDTPDTYLLIDTWIDKTSYKNFIKENNTTYQKLSTQFEYLHLTEEKIGEFNAL